MKSPGYETVTEIPGIHASREQLAMLWTRYEFAAIRAKGLEVLEVACGSGIGLGHLARRAKRVVGGDIDPQILRHARDQYADRANVEIRELDAAALPFADASFDLVLLYEAIYYLPDAAAFVREARRVIRPGGTLIICSVNPEWTEFNPSPFSQKYYSAGELRDLMEQGGFRAEIFGAFRSSQSIAAAIKRLAVRLHLIPRTMKGKQLLKRVFMGPLTALPKELMEPACEYVEPSPIAPESLRSTKVLYAVGWR